ASRAGFAGAVGLLHLWAQRAVLPVNFVKIKEPVAAVDPNRRRNVLVGVAVAGILLLAGLWGNRVLANKRENLDQLAERKTQIENQLRSLAPDNTHIQALKAWNDGAIPWLD